MTYNEHHRKTTGINRSSDKFLEGAKRKKKKKREGKKPQGLTIFLAVIIVLIFKIIY